MTTYFKWASAIQVGTSHITRDAPCQDAISVREFTDRDSTLWMVAALSDGAGSSPHSEQGSKYAVECFTDFMREALVECTPSDDTELEDLVSRGVGLVRRTISEVASTREREANDYAATFLGCVSNAERTAFVQIGDGAIIYGMLKKWELAFVPQHGEFANHTFFVTEEQHMDRIQLKVTSSPAFIVLTSDGLEECLIQPKTNEVHPPLLDYFASAFGAHEEVGECEPLSQEIDKLLLSPTVTTRTDDDTSIIALAIKGDMP